MVWVQHKDKVSDSYDKNQQGFAGAVIMIKQKKKSFSPRLMNAIFVGITCDNHESPKLKIESPASVERESSSDEVEAQTSSKAV